MQSIKVTGHFNILKYMNTIERNIISLHTINAMSIIASESKNKVRNFHTLSRNLRTFSQLSGFTISSQHAKLTLDEFKKDSGKIWFLQHFKFSQPPNMWNSSSKFPHIGILSLQSHQWISTLSMPTILPMLCLTSPVNLRRRDMVLYPNSL